MPGRPCLGVLALASSLSLAAGCDPAAAGFDDAPQAQALEEASEEPDGNHGIIGEPITKISDPPAAFFPMGCVSAQAQAIASGLDGMKTLLGICDDVTSGSQPNMLLGGCNAADNVTEFVHLVDSYPGTSGGEDAWRCRWHADGHGSAFTIEARMICCP